MTEHEQLEAWLHEAQQGSESAEEKLTRWFLDWITGVVKRFSMGKGDTTYEDQMISAGQLALAKEMPTVQGDKPVAVLKTAVRRAIGRAWNKRNVVGKQDGGPAPIISGVTSHDSWYGALLVENEEIKLFETKEELERCAVLAGLPHELITLRMEGYTTKEIADRYGVTDRSILGWEQRIKQVYEERGNE